MTTFEKASLNRNGRALQLYLSVELVNDSAFPLAPSDDVFVHPVGDVGFLVLAKNALRSAYPIRVEEPPKPLRTGPEIDVDALTETTDQQQTTSTTESTTHD